MRKQFLKDNQDKHEDNNYEFKRRDKDDKVPTIDGTNEKPKEKSRKKKRLSYFLASNMLILKVELFRTFRV